MLAGMPDVGVFDQIVAIELANRTGNVKRNEMV